MPEGILVRQKDGVVRNVNITKVSDTIFKRNNDQYSSIGHYIANGNTLHCCEFIEKRNNLFMRKLPAPFSSLLLFGDILFVLLSQDNQIKNFGVSDYRMFLDNSHKELSPGTIIEENSRRISKSDSIVEDDEEEEEEETTQENTTLGTFQTTEMSEDEEEDDEEEDETFQDDEEV